MRHTALSHTNLGHFSVRALAVGGAAFGLILAGTSVASADPTCLVTSVTGTVSDPVGALGAVLGDPVGALQADLQCVGEVIGH